MHQIGTIGHADARRAEAAILAELAGAGQPVVIAVVDATGELISILRLDGAPLACIANATHKAFTAARLRKPSWEVGKAVRDPAGGFDIAYYADCRYIGWGGGVPVLAGGMVVGAVAVSGLSEAEDQRLAEIGVKAIGVS
jgi:glc operon protein GlcG